MASKSILAGGSETKKAIGSGTRLSGYVDDPTPKQCKTCEYLVNGTLCKQKVVIKDPQIPNAARSKLKKVDPETGCCSFWEAK